MRIIDQANVQLLIERWRGAAEKFRNDGHFDAAGVLDRTADELQGLADLAVEVEL